MTPKREYIDYLRDILDSINKVEQFTEGMDFEQFSSDTKTVYAVIRALEIMGEATRNIPNPVRQRHTTVPWREMVGIRNKLIHEYFGVNLEVVWETVEQDIPRLKPMVVLMIEESEQPNQKDDAS